MELNREGHLEAAERLLKLAEDNVAWGDSNTRANVYNEIAKGHIKLAIELRLTLSKS